jgi:hypothetical protein
VQTESSHYDRKLQNPCAGGLHGCLDRSLGRSRQSPTAIGQAELTGLSPELRAQVQARAVGGNSVTEVLQVMLLNNIKIKPRRAKSLQWIGPEA